MRVEVIETLAYSVDLDKYIAEFPDEFDTWFGADESTITERDKEDFVSDTIDEFYGPYEIKKHPEIFREIGDDANVECY